MSARASRSPTTHTSKLQALNDKEDAPVASEQVKVPVTAEPLPTQATDSSNNGAGGDGKEQHPPVVPSDPVPPALATDQPQLSASTTSAEVEMTSVSQ